MIKLFSTNCPKCKVLVMKLDKKNISYEVCTDMDEMMALGIKAAPMLQVDDNTLLDFNNAIKWVNAQ